MDNFYNTLEERGLLAQCTHPEKCQELFKGKGVSLYTGFDLTADSLHVGHMMPIMGLARAQRAGHNPIFLMGGGTTQIGDPTGKTELRKILNKDELRGNLSKIERQISRFVDLDQPGTKILNNLDWLGELNYLKVLREVGRHFSVNRMLAAECFKSRMESGLSFLEFNYMILQAYDFYHLKREYNCQVQLGGDDQWSNMIAGGELIRKMGQGEGYAMTYPLLTTSEGKKMGKTEKGAVWLDAEKTSVYDYYQYWRNFPDDRTAQGLATFTFLSMDEVRELTRGGGAEMNHAKEVLAFEATAIVHGHSEATRAKEGAKAAFSGGVSRENIPTTVLNRSELNEEIKVHDLLIKSKLAKGFNEARRLIQGGGVSVNGQKVGEGDLFKISDLEDGLELKKGKKHHHLIKLDS